jgi:hypothetical protein
MSFGRNPHVAKAQAAEQKAELASDDATRIRAHRDAAHQWDRAAARERSQALREQYERSAERNRRIADGESVDDEPGVPPELLN